MSVSRRSDRIDELQPYQQGNSEIKGFSKPIKLSSNESPYGPCPEALEAFAHSQDHLAQYPDGAQTELIRAIEATHGYDSSRLICGNGSDELISLVVRAFIQPGDQAIVSENGFVMSATHCIAQGADLVVAPESDYRVNVDEILRRATDRTRFCTIANPNNPTGTYLNRDELHRLRQELHEDVVLLLDSAYAEYVDRDDYEAGAELVDQYHNVVMTRTFSKIHGLAALRVGWAYASEQIISKLQKIRTPFNVGGPAMAAAAAAMRNTEWVTQARRRNAESLVRIERALTKIGIEYIESSANFYLLRFDLTSGKSGAEAMSFLERHGIIPRPAAKGEQYLRITVGTEEQNDAVLDVLAEYMRT